MRATFLAGGKAIEHGVVDNVRSIDLAPTAAFLLDIPVPQHSQGEVLLELLERGDGYTPVPIIGLNDFHGQLDPASATIAGRNTLAGEIAAVSVGGAGQLATLFDEEDAQLPDATLLLAAGDNVGASPPNSALLQDLPAIDVENLWGLDATSYGNHEFDFGLERILLHNERADFPFLSANIIEEATGESPSWSPPSTVLTVNGVEVGVIGATVRTTPELVKAGATEGLLFDDEATRIHAESERLQRRGHRRASRGDPRGCGPRRQHDRRCRGVAVAGPDHGHHRGLAGHVRRPGDRRTHASHHQHRGRAHPRHRGRQRRWELLGRPTDGARRRRRVGRWRHAGGEEPRCRTASRRPGESSTRRTPTPRCCATR